MSAKTNFLKSPVLLVSVLVTLLFVACTPSEPQNDLMSKTDAGEIMALNDTKVDWGDINIEGGTVEHDFEFKNTGTEDLVIKKAVTSCMCTDAVITRADGTKSPKFGMHESPDWGGTIKPGETFSMKVVFDPMAHGPEAVGPITRDIYLLTSAIPDGDLTQFDAKNSTSVTVVKAMGNVLKKAEFEQLQPKI